MTRRSGQASANDVPDFLTIDAYRVLVANALDDQATQLEQEGQDKSMTRVLGPIVSLLRLSSKQTRDYAATTQE
jgi:hypothetical protein